MAIANEDSLSDEYYRLLFLALTSSFGAKVASNRRASRLAVPLERRRTPVRASSN